MKAIEAQNLTRDYGGLRAVDHISFEVEPGEIFGFLGPNGAGKTTTIRMLTGQLRPTAGTARVADCDVVTQRDALKPQIGVVFEHPNIYERLSALDNLRFTARLYGVPRGRVQEVLAQVGLADRAKERTKQYSSGMKQRLLIARALLPQPKVLFLDEPTRGLDPNMARGIRAISSLNDLKNCCAMYLEMPVRMRPPMLAMRPPTSASQVQRMSVPVSCGSRRQSTFILT